MGIKDRIIRALIGIVLLAAGFYTAYWWLDILGILALGTSIFSFCLLYKVLGVDTGCTAKDKDETSFDS